MISSLNPEQTRITNCTNLRYLDKRHRKPLVNITDREREREERRKIPRFYLSGGNEQAS